MRVKENCKLINDKGNCYYVGDKEIHVGTEKKLDMIEEYVEAWIHKIYNYSKSPKGNYNGLIFIDAMSNSGYYINQQGVEVLGTSVRVANMFEGYLKGSYADFSFEIILNDHDSQAIDCQECHLEHTDDKINISLHKKDVTIFLNDMKNYLKTVMNKHVLFFYDPFKADIYWDEIRDLVLFCKDSKDFGIDFIFTHFHQNDTSRGLLKAKKPSVIERYERTYQKSIEDLKNDTREKNGPELSEYYRNKILEVLIEKFESDERFLAYAPVFNKMNQAVYDIVFFSLSKEAKVLFKKTMYHQEKTKYKPEGQMKFQLFEDSYSNSRIEYREKDLFYSPYFYAQHLAKNFSGLNIPKADFNNYLDYHLYIPSKGALNDVKTILNKYFSVLLPVKNNNHCYIFPIYEKV